MSKTALKVTQASLNQTALDWPQNMANHYRAIDIAVEQGSDMVLMPELSITGYEVNDDFQRIDNYRIYEALMDVAGYAKLRDPNLIVSVGNPWRLQLREAFENASPNPDAVKNALYDRLNLPFNVQTLIGGGSILGMTAKANLFNDERGYEKRYFSEWSFRDADEYALMTASQSVYGTVSVPVPDGKVIPFGRPIIYVEDGNGHAYAHATAICEEKWVATKFDGHPRNDSRYRALNIIPSIPHYLETTQGVLLEIANASPPSREKQDKHMHLNNLASKYADVVVDTDGLGNSGSTFAQYGHRLIAQNGQAISAGTRLNFGQVATTTSTVVINTVHPDLKSKAHKSITRDFKAPNAREKVTFAWHKKEGQWDKPENPNRWKEELIRNQALWMFDYMRKTKSKGIAEALSGGKDSSFNCAMVRVMVELAMDDLGVEGFCEAMSHLPYNDKILAANKAGGKDAAIEACMDDMLTAVYMGTNNSSYETWFAAKTLIDGGEFDDESGTFKGIGGKFLERNVQDLVTSCAFTFGAENTSDIPLARKNEIMAVLADFVHASPYDHTPEKMEEWADEIRAKHPEIQTLTSAALPGHEIGYENFQARIREVLIMAVANVEKKMAVANPNLDEAYGAYATFGGDLHSGTVNWNAGIHKSDQEALMDYLEGHGVQNVMGRIISLAPANNNKPTAELQPKKDGEVVQNDEDALQGTFPQKAALARLKHHQKVMTDNGARWIKAIEMFHLASTDPLFSGLNSNDMFNAIAYFYQRWEGPAQHKIHASPIAPTHGESVDHQTSLRTPNLSGGSRDEIVQLGIYIMSEWAYEDGLGWSDAMCDTLYKRAWQDKGFVDEFYGAIWNKDDTLPNMSYNLRSLYGDLKKNGWDKTFTPLADTHPISVLSLEN